MNLKTAIAESAMSAILILLWSVAFSAVEPRLLIAHLSPLGNQYLKVEVIWGDLALEAHPASEEAVPLAVRCGELCCDGEVE